MEQNVKLKLLLPVPPFLGLLGGRPSLIQTKDTEEFYLNKFTSWQSH